MSVSVTRMSPSSNQRRAIPVVTMMRFHVAASGVASPSRFTTPTLSAVRGTERSAGGASRRDDDDAARGRLELHESVAIGREPVPILNRARHGRGRCKVGAQMKSPLDERAFVLTMGDAV